MCRVLTQHDADFVPPRLMQCRHGLECRHLFSTVRPCIFNRQCLSSFLLLSLWFVCASVCMCDLNYHRLWAT